MVAPEPDDSPLARKARGAFFTPPPLARYVAAWAVRSSNDMVLEPSCGDAAFLLAAGARLDSLTPGAGRVAGHLDGVEMHEQSARQAETALAVGGYKGRVVSGDFFEQAPTGSYDAVIGNPPYVRYQGFSGATRARSREAALRANVALTDLASSWAAFTVHSALFCKPGARLGLVLPGELLTVNYAAAVRRFLMERFARVRLVLFTERVFPGVLEEVVLLLADGYNQGPAKFCELVQARNADDLDDPAAAPVARRWKPAPVDGKWTGSLLSPEALEAYAATETGESFVGLNAWGETTLGMVTGNNKYFALSEARARELELPNNDLVTLSPPGSRHLRGLSFTATAHANLAHQGAATRLFRPPGDPSPASERYIAMGEDMEVNNAYKCRVRRPWWRVPLLPPPDIMLTYMNADTPRLCANRARAHHLNSVHGVYLNPRHRRLGVDLLPIAALTSMTLLGAETVGRAYGGGMLKIEPREADRLPVPTPAVLDAARDALAAIRPQVNAKLRTRRGLLNAVKLVDDVLLVGELGIGRSEVRSMREAHVELAARRAARGKQAR